MKSSNANPQIGLREVLIKSGMQITQTDFSIDCTKTTQEYLMYFKEFSCNLAENMQVRCVPRFIQRFLRNMKPCETYHFPSKCLFISSMDNNIGLMYNVISK